MSEPDTKTFQAFIKDLLIKRAKARRELADTISTTYLAEFEKAFTHKSFERCNVSNYEYLEFIGDKKANSIIADYIGERLPEVISVRWLTRIHQYLVSSKMLSKIADAFCFLPHIKLGEEQRDFLVRESDGTLCATKNGVERVNANEIEMEDAIAIVREKKMKMSSFSSVLEDCFEAFIGAVFISVSNHMNKGIAYMFCANIIIDALKDMDMEFTYETLWDAKSRIKEMVYDPNRWGINKAIIPTPLEPKGYKVSLYAWKEGEPPSRQTMYLVATADAKTKAKAEQKACEIGIEYFAAHGYERRSHNMYSVYS